MRKSPGSPLRATHAISSTCEPPPSTAKSTPSAPGDFYVTDAGLKSGAKLTDLDEQVKPFTWSSGSQIVDYTVTLGKNGPTRKLQASLFLPANYVKGKSYPTLVYIYEKLSQGHYGFATPSANGFNKTVYTSNGYAVLMPDITYRLNDPGMSAVWCLTAAVKAAVATGVVDPKHIGLQGHSWGGYQTAFTVTQTDLFAAAVCNVGCANAMRMEFSPNGPVNTPEFGTVKERAQPFLTPALMRNIGDAKGDVETAIAKWASKGGHNAPSAATVAARLMNTLNAGTLE